MGCVVSYPFVSFLEVVPLADPYADEIQGAYQTAFSEANI